MSFDWDSDYETGNVSIDEQHRELLGIVNALESAEAHSHSSRDAILEVLGQIMDFHLVHFQMEEDLMTEVDYPAGVRREMIVQHREFTTRTRQRVLEFRDGDLISVLPLQSFLAEWLIEHEFGLDKALADFIRGGPQAAAGPAAG